MKFKKNIAFLLVILNIFICSFKPEVSAIRKIKNITLFNQVCSIPKEAHGFISTKQLQYKNTQVFHYIHAKSGANLVFQKNNNINKVIEFNFKTPPKDNTGVNHVLEHSLLEANQRYPGFFKLHDSAFSTKLNACTSLTNTFYTVSSLDEDEANSLAKIYMSYIFEPSILNNDKAFKQEGIRFELDENGKLKANGIVFNEVNDSSYLELMKRLEFFYPDTQTKFFSGGISSELMDLTYEEFLDTYKKFYHPANCLITITGNLNIEKTLKWLSEDYLNNFEKQDFNAENVKFIEQNPVKTEDNNYKVIDLYRASGDINWCDVWYILNRDLPVYSLASYETLSNIISDPNSERNKKLRDDGWTDIQSDVYNFCFYEPVFHVVLSTNNSKLLTKENIKKTIDEILYTPFTTAVIDKYLDNDDFLSEIKKKTLIYDESIKNDYLRYSWLRSNDPISNKIFNITGDKLDLNYDKDTVHQMLGSVEKILPKERHAILVSNYKDDFSLSDEYRIREKLNKLEDKKNEIIIEKQIPEHKTASSFGSMLKKISDLDIQKLSCNVIEKTVNNKKCHFALEDISDLIVCELMFKINNLSDEDIKYMYLLLEIFNSNDSSDCTRSEIENMKSQNIITFFGLDATTNIKSEQNAFANMGFITTKEKLEQAFFLMNTQTFNIKFDNKDTIKKWVTQILNNINENKSQFNYSQFINSQKLNSQSFLCRFNTEEITFFLKSILENINDEKFLSYLTKKLEQTFNNLFNKTTLESFAVICAQENCDEVSNSIEKFINSLDDVPENIYKIIKEKNNKPLELPNKFKHKKIAIINKNFDANKVAMYLDINCKDHSAELECLCEYITDYFLYKEIRVNNGVYHTHMRYNVFDNNIEIKMQNGQNLKETLKTFGEIMNFLKTNEITQEAIEGISKKKLSSSFITSKLAISSQVLGSKICQGLNFCDYLNNHIESFKHMTVEKIKSVIPILEAAFNQPTVGALFTQITDNDKELFDEIIDDNR
ncbi:MAG: peptidase M16 [Candidatus Improbicoccus devescovinae]|nr:MAG: peptidase M16 [Candidatus Improbicoccus devescovinae]